MAIVSFSDNKSKVDKVNSVLKTNKMSAFIYVNIFLYGCVWIWIILRMFGLI
jgi:hypothetical protein